MWISFTFVHASSQQQQTKSNPLAFIHSLGNMGIAFFSQQVYNTGWDNLPLHNSVITFGLLS